MKRCHLTTRILAAASLAGIFMMGMAVADGYHHDAHVNVIAQADPEETANDATQGEPMTYLIDFQAPDESSRWRAINDNVMGGISRGGMQVEDDIGVFSGEISLENNGGFASVRREPEAFDLSDHEGLALHVRGDGRRYQLRLRTDQLFDDGAYRALFQPPAGEWQRIALAWREFEAVFRGRRLEDAPPLDPGAIQQVGFLIADKRPGPFRLEVAWLQAMSK
ncbi:MAG: CIA30 family protein [Halomonas sp.]|uniref:CIA30 family protein n=1 Tax=Halomonas sp. TaxID=1486246 RepID=UPI002ACD7FCF|nr:CIA30 family protein [Halomonas sp.]MDZ7853228.1 CIA30 family protein [Halomonas sp.]